MRRLRRDAVASESVAEEAALALLAEGANALGAALGGFFAAAGASPGVLLGPMCLLIGGVAQGARAFDGRLRQPGRSTRRPRGFQSAEEIPKAAFVAVPAAVEAAIIALAYGGGATLAAVVRPGVQTATARGATNRVRLLERIADVGASALIEAAFTRPLLRIAGESEGGLLTPADFEAKDDIDVAASIQDENWLTAPWLSNDAPGASGGRARGLCVADAHGGLAALAYREIDSGIPVEELDLLAPLSAVPVRRGITRVAPGTSLAMPFAAALTLKDQLEVALEPESTQLEANTPRAPRLALRVSAETRFVTRAS